MRPLRPEGLFWLSIARDDVVRQRQEGVALGAAGTRSAASGALGKLLGATEGIVDRPVFAEHLQQLVPLLLGDGPRGDDVADDSRPAGVALAQQVDERKRHLAFTQVGADWLAERSGVASEIEQVVDHLEGDTEVECMLAQRFLLLRGDAAEHAADLRRASNK